MAGTNLFLCFFLFSSFSHVSEPMEKIQSPPGQFAVEFFFFLINSRTWQRKINKRCLIISAGRCVLFPPQTLFTSKSFLPSLTVCMFLMAKKLRENFQIVTRYSKFNDTFIWVWKFCAIISQKIHLLFLWRNKKSHKICHPQAKKSILHK